MGILAHTHAVIIAWGTVTENTCSWLAEPVLLPACYHIRPLPRLLWGGGGAMLRDTWFVSRSIYYILFTLLSNWAFQKYVYELYIFLDKTHLFVPAMLLVSAR